MSACLKAHFKRVSHNLRRRLRKSLLEGETQVELSLQYIVREILARLLIDQYESSLSTQSRPLCISRCCLYVT